MFNSSTFRAIALSAAFGIVASGAFAEQCSTPLPNDLLVPSPHASEGAAALLGKWGNAKWNKVLCHTLVVESLPTDTTASTVYSWGIFEKWGVKMPGYVRVVGVFREGTLYLEFPSPQERAEYRLVDGRMHGKYFSKAGVSTIVMERQP